ncbi:hypothetical protein [Erythrobacter sp. A6_0]|uniref:hypothetical protein n=1 Tax=Erythrobacter sp. A6_0 TaxID=2821089 RepID=UPI001ADCD8F4|nr:hypothetical protein [Erythrobacter sp. A6_0]MBO9510701.1 hypothetical protein [Erythrobacter sp. A6_0]
MSPIRLPLWLAAPLALAACGEAPAPEPTPSATPTVAAPRTLVAADFDPESLGAKIVGPQGPQPEAAIMADGREIARIKSFVACPRDTAECVPAEMPEGTVYTYVHEITLADDLTPQVIETPETEGAALEVPASLFRMTQAAAGFNRSVGYSRSQAEAALGAGDAIQVSSDSGEIIWRVTAGSGWKPGMPVTFWWQSTTPPDGPADAYSLEVNGMTASAKGPFPAAETNE